MYQALTRCIPTSSSRDHRTVSAHSCPREEDRHPAGAVRPDTRARDGNGTVRFRPSTENVELFAQIVTCADSA